MQAEEEEEDDVNVDVEEEEREEEKEERKHLGSVPSIHRSGRWLVQWGVDRRTPPG